MIDHPVTVPASLAAAQIRYRGEQGRRWVAGLPALAAAFLQHWRLRPDGPAGAGHVALVLPVRQSDGTPAVLKLQAVDDETGGEPVALRAWDGDGAVRLLAHDEATGTMLLERLAADKPLSTVPDAMAALELLSQLLARLVSAPAPAGLRRLDDIATEMIDRTPVLAVRLADPGQRRLLERCAATVAELLPVREHRLLHWDLHYDNVLAAHREPWLAIDPKPLAGEAGFELLPALRNRWDEVLTGGDVAAGVRRRFDLMTEVLDLDRARAAGWTLARVLQDASWDLQEGQAWIAPAHAAIATALLPRLG